MKRVYIACPISKPDSPEGMLNNVKQADDAMYTLMKAGLSPFNPALSVFCGSAMLFLRSLGGCVIGIADRQASGQFRSLSHKDWLTMDLEWVAVSEALLRLPGESTGADGEVAHAKSLGIPVFYDVHELIAWANTINAGV